MGFAFWIIGVIISSMIYFVVLLAKFNIRFDRQYITEKISFGERFGQWVIKGIFFILTFSFSAVLRPYYYIGKHSNQYIDSCACVDGDIGLIAEIYGAALISILLGLIKGSSP